ncbi:MAG TPA: hypothetical protein VM533_22495 [Fimbriiglobus sp.]|jgi:hypothetical protein|nr:hypothetical protein [Fimbriiglobus sp.]
MPKLFSYVVDHDYGLSPNPSGGFCTLAFCKYKKTTRRNIQELAEVDDWVIGTGGSGPHSAGHGRLVYAMCVTEKLTLRDYFHDARFIYRAGNDHDFCGRTDVFALISNHFFYFGSHAPKFAERHLKYPIEKRGRGHRSHFPEDFVADFVAWLEQRYRVGVHGSPCADHPDFVSPQPPIRPGRKCSLRRPSKC